MNQAQIIKLIIKGNSHRLIVSLGEKVTLFCSAKYNFVRGNIEIAGIKIQSQGRPHLSLEQDVFDITSDDAARLMNRLKRKAFSGSISLATSSIQAKWDTPVGFAAKDFE